MVAKKVRKYNGKEGEVKVMKDNGKSPLYGPSKITTTDNTIQFDSNHLVSHAFTPLVFYNHCDYLLSFNNSCVYL